MILTDKGKEKDCTSRTTKGQRTFHHTLFQELSDMAAVPQSYLMAKSKKKRKAEKEHKPTPSAQYQDIDTDSQPMRYNNKMMNSIWGQYNMYSVHNLKAVENDARARFNAPLQQMIQEESQAPMSLPISSQVTQMGFFEYASVKLNKVEESVSENLFNPMRL